MLSFVAFTGRPEDGPCNHAVGLVVHIDHEIPGYSSIMTVPRIGPPIGDPLPVEVSRIGKRWLLVVTAHQGNYLDLLRQRKPKIASHCRRITSAEQLAGISDAEVVFLADWDKLPEASAIMTAAWQADDSVEITLGYHGSLRVAP